MATCLTWGFSTRKGAMFRYMRGRSTDRRALLVSGLQGHRSDWKEHRVRNQSSRAVRGTARVGSNRRVTPNIPACVSHFSLRKRELVRFRKIWTRARDSSVYTLQFTLRCSRGWVSVEPQLLSAWPSSFVAKATFATDDGSRIARDSDRCGVGKLICKEGARESENFWGGYERSEPGPFGSRARDAGRQGQVTTDPRVAVPTTSG